MAIELLGYSERGLINAFFYDALAADNLANVLTRVLNKLVDAEDSVLLEENTQVEEGSIIIEPGLSEYGNPDIIITYKLGDGSSHVLYLEAKVHSYKRSDTNNCGNSTISCQLLQKIDFIGRINNIPEDTHEDYNLFAQEWKNTQTNKALKDELILRELIFKRLLKAGDHIIGCITTDLIYPDGLRSFAEDNPDLPVYWISFHELKIISETFQLDNYRQTVEFNSEKFWEIRDFEELEEVHRQNAEDLLNAIIHRWDKPYRISGKPKLLIHRSEDNGSKRAFTIFPMINTLEDQLKFRLRKNPNYHPNKLHINQWTPEIEEVSSYDLYTDISTLEEIENLELG